jgi:hypothetical protein
MRSQADAVVGAPGSRARDCGERTIVDRSVFVRARGVDRRAARSVERRLAYIDWLACSI